MMYDMVMGVGAAANYRSITDARACASGGGNGQASLQFVYDVIRVRDVRVSGLRRHYSIEVFSLDLCQRGK